jgi:hypothetical protein
MSEAAELIEDEDTKDLVIDVLAEFFQDSFKDDPLGVGDWLAQNGTSADLFVELVAALRRPQETNAP